MAQPSTAFRVVLSPLVLILGLAVLHRYALGIVFPDSVNLPPPRKASTPRPLPAIPLPGPPPAMVKQLMDGPNRAMAASSLGRTGFTDSSWMPGIEAGLAETRPEDQFSLLCLRLKTPHSEQRERIRNALMDALFLSSGRREEIADCALAGLVTLVPAEKGSLVGSVLAFVRTHPRTLDAAANGLSGIRVEPLPDEVVRMLDSPRENEKIDGFKLALSLGAGDFAPDVLLLATAPVAVRMRSTLAWRRDGASARFLFRFAADHPSDEVARLALVNRLRTPGAGSDALVEMALDIHEPEAVRAQVIEMVTFYGEPGACAKFEPLSRSALEVVRAYAQAALMEPQCRP